AGVLFTTEIAINSKDAAKSDQAFALLPQSTIRLVDDLKFDPRRNVSGRATRVGDRMGRRDGRDARLRRSVDIDHVRAQARAYARRERLRNRVSCRNRQFELALVERISLMEFQHGFKAGGRRDDARDFEFFKRCYQMLEAVSRE